MMRSTKEFERTANRGTKRWMEEEDGCPWSYSLKPFSVAKVEVHSTPKQQVDWNCGGIIGGLHVSEAVTRTPILQTPTRNVC